MLEVSSFFIGPDGKLSRTVGMTWPAAPDDAGNPRFSLLDMRHDLTYPACSICKTIPIIDSSCGIQFIPTVTNRALNRRFRFPTSHPDPLCSISRHRPNTFAPFHLPYIRSHSTSTHHHASPHCLARCQTSCLRSDNSFGQSHCYCAR